MVDYLSPYRDAKRTDVSSEPAECFSLDALMTASKKCEQGTIWKESVQKFAFDRARNCCKMRKLLLSGEYKISPGFTFTVNERGKLRNIKAISIWDRVPQRSLCDHLYVPLVQSVVTKDNSACLPGRGMHYALYNVGDIMKALPYDFWYVKYDCKSYFNSIDHNILKDIQHYLIRNKIINDFMDQIIDNDHPDPNNYNIGIELGSPVNQISGLLYLNQVDQTIPLMDGVLGYQRYMDDGLVFCKDRDTCKRVVETIRVIMDILHLHLNEKKTYYNKSTQPFVFLKRRFTKKKNGRYKMVPTKKSIRGVKKRLSRTLANERVQNKDMILSSYYGHLSFGTYNMFDEALEVAVEFPQLLVDTRYDTTIGKLLYDYALSRGIRVDMESNVPTVQLRSHYSVAEMLERHYSPLSLVKEPDRP